MADVGTAPWAWMKEVSDMTSYVGGNCADSSGWFGQHIISAKLEADFIDWALSFEIESLNDFVATDWAVFHDQGHALCHRLKQELVDAAQVCYVKPSEDPSKDYKSGIEFLIDGNTKPYGRIKKIISSSS